MSELIWSVTIPTYNSAEFLEDTLLSVLQQDTGSESMEIIVVDNCSIDNTQQIVERIGNGRIKFLINEKNVGAVGNFNKCIEAAKGKLVHVLNSDDIVKQGFYRSIEKAFEEYPVSIVICQAEIIDEEGNHKGYSEDIPALLTPSKDIASLLYGNPIRTPAVVVKREAYDTCGKFDTNLSHVGDWDMWVRVIHQLGGIYISQALCKYRVHSSSDTSNAFLSGRDVLDFEKIFQKFEANGYAIDKESYRKTLRSNAAWHYTMAYEYHHKNVEALRKLRSIYTRYASSYASLLLTSKLEIRLFTRKVNDTLIRIQKKVIA
ncbi:MAG: glycosyltransferase [Janthinobacterium lividum]